MKLIALLAVYGLKPNEPNCWFFLALKLAEAYHPGFKVVDEKSHRRGGRSNGRSERIFQEVNRRARENGVGVTVACGEMARTREYGGKSKDPNEIKARYYEARRKHRQARIAGYD